MDLTIITTAWNRTPERFDVFKETVLNFKDNVTFGKYKHQWKISIEPENHCLKDEMEYFCKEHNISVHYKPGKPNFGKNLNHALSLCNTPYIFYLQDDWKLFKKINFEEDIDYLKNNNDKVYLIRYYLHELKYFPTPLNQQKNIYLIDPSSGRYYYSDNPHLKKKEYHQKTGPYFENNNPKDSSLPENQMATIAQKISKEYKIAIKLIEPGDDCFVHIGRNCTTLNEKYAERWKKQGAKNK